MELSGLSTASRSRASRSRSSRRGRRSEEHTSELQSPCNLVCRLLLEKKKQYDCIYIHRRTIEHPGLLHCLLRRSALLTSESAYGVDKGSKPMQRLGEFRSVYHSHTFH